MSMDERPSCASYAHTMVKPPDPIRTPKLSTIGPAQYCGGGPRGNRRWCTFCHNKCSCGPMAKACDYESRDWGFESLQECFLLLVYEDTVAEWLRR